MESLPCAPGSGPNDGPCNPCDIENSELLVANLEEQRSLKVSVENVALEKGSHDCLIARFPFEIVSRLFQDYVEMHIQTAPDSPFVSLRPPMMEGAPLRLGAVCHTWRAIAWASPRLWTKMSLNLNIQGRKSIPELAMQWLDRTGQHPLSLCLYHRASKDTATTETKDYISMICAVCAFSSRWETLDIFIGKGAVSDELISQYWVPVNDGRVSRLRHLRLRDLSPTLTRNLFKNFHPRPSPQHVVLIGMEDSMDFLDVGWSDILKFYTESISKRHYREIIQATHHLQNLTVLNIVSGSDATPSKSIILPALRSLELVNHPSMILGSLTLPSLERLRWSPVANSIECLISLIKRSQCQLKSLQFDYCMIPNPDINLLLEVTPCLRELHFDDLAGRGVQRLTEYLSMTHLDGLSINLPHLTYLRINVAGMFPWDILLNIFDPSTGQNSPSEKPQALRRQSLKLQIHMIGLVLPDQGDYIDKKLLHRISKLRDQGIKISILRRLGGRHDQDFIASSLAFHYPQRENTATEH